MCTPELVLSVQGEVHDLAWLPREYPNGVQVVVSTLPGRCMNTIQQRGWHTLRVEPLNETERQVRHTSSRSNLRPAKLPHSL
jgi:hypothetical protein